MPPSHYRVIELITSLLGNDAGPLPSPLNFSSHLEVKNPAPKKLNSHAKYLLIVLQFENAVLGLLWEINVFFHLS